MHFTLTGRRLRSLVAAVAALLITGAASSPASAESAYVQQVRAGTVAAIQVLPGITPGTTNTLQNPQRTTSFVLTPETTVPGRGRNVAQTLQIGSFNQVAQIQAGANNRSTVGIIAGHYNRVGVLQAGNNLRSNLVLLNTRGLAVGVLQPNGSTPVNMLIARLPNGGLLIKR
jgi:hypothetical protein